MGNGPTVGVLALQGDVREHRRILESLGAQTRAVRTAAELGAIDGLVIPGGESTTMWRLARTFGLLEPLRKHLQAGLPAYGSCAGMIMLADRIRDGVAGQETIGGLDITVRRNAFGRQVDSFEAELDFPVIGEPALRAVFIRAPWVEEVGPGVEVLARVRAGTSTAVTPEAHGTGGGSAASPEASASAGGFAASPEASASAGGFAASPEASASAGRIVAVRAGGLLATSFHPELTADARIHAHFLEIIKEA